MKLMHAMYGKWMAISKMETTTQRGAIEGKTQKNEDNRYFYKGT